MDAPHEQPGYLNNFCHTTALQPDPICGHLSARGALVAPRCHQKHSKHLLFLDFTASHKLGITYREILNFTPLPATCSQFLAMVWPPPVSTTCPFPIWWPQIRPCFSLVWNVLFSLSRPFLIPVFQVQAQTLPLPRILSCYDLQTPVTSLLGILTMTTANVNLLADIAICLTIRPPTHPSAHP